MWGNKEGWIFAVVVAAFMGWMLLSFGRVEPIAAPSGQFPNLEARVALPNAPADTLPGVMTDDRDAGDQYRQAIQTYLAFPKGYERFDVKSADASANLPAVQLVLDAASAKKAMIFLDKPATLVNYRYPWPELDAIFNVGQIVNSVGHYYAVSPKNPNEEKALKYLHAGFSLGAKLFEERLVHGEMLNGMQLMQGAASSLRELAKRKGDKATEARMKAFGDQTSNYYSAKVQPLYQKVVSSSAGDISQYAGDVFALASRNPDRMWRVESLLKLGRMKYEKGGSAADQMWANRLLTQPERYGAPDLSKDPDPAVREAAIAARDLTIDGLNQVK